MMKLLRAYFYTGKRRKNTLEPYTTRRFWIRWR